MIDNVKLRTDFDYAIARISGNNNFNFIGNHIIDTGEKCMLPEKGKWGKFQFIKYNEFMIEIKGSLHNYWNNGTNENDFFIYHLLTAIIDFCNILNVNPYHLTIHNLEFGVNIRPQLNASKIIDNIISYKNKLPIKELKTNKYFIEFEMCEYYFKIYDKGLQSKEIWGKDIGNVLRIEIKSMTSGFIADANIKTLSDLLNIEKLQVLGKKINKLFKYLVFDDHTIKPDLLSKPDHKNYMLFCNPRTWHKNKNIRTSTIVAKENRFRVIVNKYGTLQLDTTIPNLINEKWNELLTPIDGTIAAINDFLQHCKDCGFSYLEYTKKPNNIRTCLSCGSDISHQHPRTKFCSAKFVGEQQAHKCRNMNSNPRNNYKNGLKRIMAKGATLFDLTPFLKAM